MRGKFITFEGGEGGGKSTQVKLLAEAFAHAKLPCLVTREPGGTESAERIRSLLVSGDKDAWFPESETLLFYAARIEHVKRKILPALKAGTHVLCDRFADSTMVYQGAGKGLPEELIEELHQLIIGNFAPNLTLILDIDPEIGLARAKSQPHDEKRFEAMDMDFHHRIRSRFLALAKQEPDRCVMVSAGQERAALHHHIKKIVTQRLDIKL